MYERYRAAFEGRRFPLAYVDLDLFDQNCRDIAAMVQPLGKSVRIHTKSLRIPGLMRRILDSSPVFQGLMCFSPREAVHLCEQGFEDILIGYPCVNMADIRDVLQCVKQTGKKVVFMFDSQEQLERYEVVARELDTQAYVCMDVDMSSGNEWRFLRHLHFFDEM